MKALDNPQYETLAFVIRRRTLRPKLRCWIEAEREPAAAQPRRLSYATLTLHFALAAMPISSLAANTGKDSASWRNRILPPLITVAGLLSIFAVVRFNVHLQMVTEGQNHVRL